MKVVEITSGSSALKLSNCPILLLFHLDVDIK